MVVIRLSRSGSKKKPFYHLVAANKRCPRGGRYLENIGYFNPLAKGKAVRLKLSKERISYWLSVGAQLSDRVKSLVKEWETTTSYQEN
jgi:small subunit ribosomal protein S16